jgi:hypothetical protein
VWRGRRRLHNRAGDLFRMAAYSLHHDPTPLGAYLRRMKSRLGPAGATTATAHKIAIIFFTMVSTPRLAVLRTRPTFFFACDTSAGAGSRGSFGSGPDPAAPGCGRSMLGRLVPSDRPTPLADSGCTRPGSWNTDTGTHGCAALPNPEPSPSNGSRSNVHRLGAIALSPIPRTRYLAILAKPVRSALGVKNSSPPW